MNTDLNDFLENPAMDFNNFEDYSAMVADYNYQLLMWELRLDENELGA